MSDLSDIGFGYKRVANTRREDFFTMVMSIWFSIDGKLRGFVS